MIRAQLWVVAALCVIFGASCGSPEADGSNPSGDYRVVVEREEDTEDFARALIYLTHPKV